MQKLIIWNLNLNETIDESDSYYIQTEETIEKLHERIEFLENSKTSHEKTRIIKESYDERINILINGI